MAVIHLDFVNRAYDLERPDVVFFQRDRANRQSEVVAWKVVHRCGVDWHHPFRVPRRLDLSLVDADGNHTPPIELREGRRYTLARRRDGARCWLSGPAREPTSIEVSNRLAAEPISCRLTRDERPVVPLRRVAPGGETSFSLGLGLWVGAVWRARQGKPLGPFEVEASPTCLDLAAIRRAEVLMVGGGTGASALPFRFHLRPLE